MNNEVKTEIHPLSDADFKKIRKTAVQTLLLLPFVIAFFCFIFYQFFRSDLGPMKYFLYFFIAFFLFVIGIVLFNIFQSLRSKEKIVQEGYITNKRVNIRRSTSSSHNGKSSSSTTIHHYLSLGLEEILVSPNFYNQVKKGDFVKIEKTIKNKDVFNIEVLKAGLDEKAEALIIGPPKTVFTRSEDTKIIQKAFFKALLFRLIFGAAVLYGLSLIATLIVLLVLDKQMNSEYLIYPIYFIRFIFIVLFILLNIKTYKLFLDQRVGEKIVSTEKIVDVFFKGYGGSGTSLNRDSYHVVTSSGFSFIVDQKIGETLQSGDLMQLCYSPNARILLETKKADIY